MKKRTLLHTYIPMYIGTKAKFIEFYAIENEDEKSIRLVAEIIGKQDEPCEVRKELAINIKQSWIPITTKADIAQKEQQILRWKKSLEASDSSVSGNGEVILRGGLKGGWGSAQHAGFYYLRSEGRTIKIQYLDDDICIGGHPIGGGTQR